ncbi:MAG: ABC transporter permease [Lachnospiraceae bacterium]
MKNFFKLYKVEQKLFFRSPDVFIFNLCMPVVVLIMIGLIAGSKLAGDSGMTYLESSFVAVTSVGICCSAFMSIPITMVDYRDKKILKHFYCSPCSPARLLLVDIICSGVMAALSAVCVTLAACVLFGYRMSGNVAVYILTWFLTMIAMFSIGLLVAALCKTTKSMNVATSLLYFPMLLFSGATIPYELFPKGMQPVAGYMPLGIGIRLMKAASVGSSLGTMGKEILILVLIAVICTSISIKTFRWE